jgi:6-phosphofructokinase 1
MKGRLGILTGGGDVPGLNPCIKAFVLRARDEGFEVLGIRRGWAGLLNLMPDAAADNAEWARPLDASAVRTIDRYGGTVLHTSRTNPMKVRPKEVPAHLAGQGEPVQGGDGAVDLTRACLRHMEFLGLQGLAAIGGDDTLSVAARLDGMGAPVVGIPKTMDNDVFGTDYCIGFSTAVTRSVNFITDLRTPAGSHERIAVVELFGRNSGETALLSSYVAGVDRAIISEVPFDPERLAKMLIEDKRGNPSHYAMLSISEGARPIGGEVMEFGEPDAFGHRQLGGIGQWTGERIRQLTGEHTLVQQLRYLMRSGPPDALDRLVASNYANLAMDLVLRREFGRMVGLTEGRYTWVPLATVSQGVRRVNVQRYYDSAAYRPHVIEVHGLPMFLH